MTDPRSTSTRSTCRQCGVAVPAGARFCMSCGADVSGEQGNAPTVQLATGFASEDDLLQALRRATAGEYEILAELGRGGMATVFLAQDLALNRKVAVKVMSPTLSLLGPGMVERFKREARTAASLSHPHIIPIHAVREGAQLLYFVMKFVPGRSLESMIREKGPLPIPMVQAILIEVGGALAYAHRQGVVHRDIKPANIMVDEEGWAMVTDFGIAKASDAKGLTMTGVTVGTPTYMSPEQCSGKEVMWASDQYSLGVVAYEMLTGHAPFEADTTMGLLYAHFNEIPKPVADIRPDSPPELAQAVARMLAKEPAQRFPTMADALAAIGGQAPKEGDSVRTELAALAKAGSNQRSIPATPPSPVPRPSGPPVAPRRPSMARASTRIVAGPGSATQPRMGRYLLLTALGVVVGGAVLWGLKNPGHSTPGVPPEEPKRRVVAADRVPEPGPDSTITTAARPVPPSPRPAPTPGTPAAATPKPQPPPPPPKQPPDYRPQVSSVLAELARAFENRDLDRMKTLWPTMPERLERNYDRLFHDRRVRSIHADYELRDLTQNGDTLEAQVHERVMVQRLIAAQNSDKTFAVRLVRAGDGWKILDSKQDTQD